MQNVLTGKPNLKPEKQAKKGKAFLIFLVFILCTLAISAAFFFGWKYFKEKIKKAPTEKMVEERLAFETKKEIPSFMFSEFSDVKEPHLWKNTNLVSLSDQKIYPIPLSRNVYSFTYPQISGERIYYYTSEDKPENFKSQSLTLWSSDLFGENEKKIVSYTSEFYPSSLFLSPNGKYLVYLRILKKKPEETAIWLYDIEQELSRELVSFSSKFYFEGLKSWNSNSSKFYFFEKEGNVLQLKEVKIEGTEILSSFPKIDFSKLPLADMSEFGEFTFFVSPDESSIYYLKKEKIDNKIKSSSLISIKTQTAEEKVLVKLDGDISKVVLSLDGNKFAFRLKPADSDFQEIYIVDSNGQNLKKITRAAEKDEVLSDLMFSDSQSKFLGFVRKIYHKYTKVVQINLEDLQEKAVLSYNVADPQESSYLRLLQYVLAPKNLKWGEKKEGLKETLEKVIEKKEIKKTEGEAVRQEVMKYIEKNIENFAPFAPTPGSFWNVLRYAFVSDENLYVECEDGHTITRVLLRCTKIEGDIRCTNIASFAPENLRWRLTSGTDPFSDRIWQYYEKDLEGIWQKSFKSDEITFFPQGRDGLIGIQEAVDRGHNLWHRDPLDVVKTEMLSAFGFDPTKDDYELLEQNEQEGKARVKIVHLNEVYEVDLEQPIKKGREGIWVMVRMIKISR